MPWLQLHFTVAQAEYTKLEQALLEQGACSITLGDAQDEAQFEKTLGETPLWSLMTLSALFEAHVNPQQILAQLNRNSTYPLPACQIEYLEDKDWAREWMQYFQPLQMGQRLWICPSWLEAPNPNAVNLMLDPGLAFGTGTHPTTALCLAWLDQQACSGYLANKTVIDYGCGSGILAIAALLLGCQHAIAIDHDPQAIIATRDNAEKNGISMQQLKTYATKEEPAALSSNIILANILAEPLLQLAEKFAGFCTKSDTLVLSGILNSQIDTICDKYKKDFRITTISTQGDWARIDCSKR